MDEAFALANGERLVVSVLGPGEGRGVTAVQLDAYNFLTRPFDPWMVPTEGAFLAEFLAGTHDPSLADTMLIGRIDGTIVGTAWHGTDRDLPEMGGYGFVFTDPAQRGKGVAQRLTELAIRGILVSRRSGQLPGNHEPGGAARLRETRLLPLQRPHHARAAARDAA